MRSSKTARQSLYHSIQLAVLAILGLIILTATPASAFDGTRKGFVLGGSLGYAPVMSWDVEDGFNENRAGGGAGLLIGYAWNQHNMVVYQSTLGIRGTDMLEEDDIIGQYFSGAQYYRYFGSRGHAWFLTAGLGSVMLVTEYENIEGDGFGLAFGAGYEFAKQVQIGLQYFGGTAGGNGFDHRIDVLLVQLTVVAY